MFEAALGFALGFVVASAFWLALFYEVEGNDSDLVERPRKDEGEEE